ncbi:MAG TPA: insulinase family protein [Vicinamibacterales bacterium]
MRAAYLVSALLLLAPSAGETQDRQDLGAPLPLDIAIRTGTLPNGLTFFIRHNGLPNDHVMLRLVVKAGSIDEADDQRGLAHMLEHMAFNGTAHFKPGELVSYLESIGAQFGAHVNAYTSFDETVFMLDVPTEKPGVLDRGFEALSDFASGLSLDPEEIDRERGVVIEEWRGRLGAGTRLQEPQMKAMFGASRYIDRIPIGLPDVLRTFPPQRLRDFYREFYRPDRMAVIVVGDIEVEKAEALVRQHFSGMPVRPPAVRSVYEIPAHQDTRYVSLSDKELQSSSVTIMHKHPLRELRTMGDYRRTLAEGLVYQMMNARFAEIARRPDAPFLGASAGDDTLGRTIESFEVSARVKDGAIATGLTALATELARVRQHGFGEAELDRAKRNQLAGYERAYNERDKSQSEPLTSELVRHYLQGEAAPGIALEVQLARRFLSTITAAETAAIVREFVTDANRVVIATAPEKAGLTATTEQALRTALTTGASATVTPWKDDVASRVLLAKAPTPGKVTNRREISEIGVTVLTLSNGVEVWLKPTDFRNDQVLFTSYARGGLSLATPTTYQEAALANSLVALGGIGGFNPTDLQKLLAGKIANASASISSATEGISGSATPKDLETALQLAYLEFTAPNSDPAAFALLKQRLEAVLANQAQSPGAVFAERVRRINTMDHYTATPLKVEDLAGFNPDRMLTFYKERFSNAADFTFFFVGAFKVDDITPLIATYIGSLPSRGVRDGKLGDLRLQFPTTVVQEKVTKGQEPRSQTVMTFFADTGLDELETHRVQAATSVLEMRLRDILREKLGGTYSVNVGYSNTSPQPGYGTTSVQFGSAPENVESLTAAVMTEIDRLRREGPSAADVQAVKEQEKNGLQESLLQNGYWLNSLQAMHLLGRDPRRILQRMERAESLSVENIHAAIRKYFPSDRRTVVTLMPEVPASRTQ